MQTSMVLKWLTSYGFLRAPDGGKDIFVHVTALPEGRDHLCVGEVVAFNVTTNERGTHATDVQIVQGKTADIERSYAQHVPVRMGDD